MSIIADKTDKILEPVTEAEISSEHRAWMNGEISKTLENKAKGEMRYRPLAKVMAKFGFNAR